MEPLRLGIISTAGINTLSIFDVIPKVKGIRVQAVASRDLSNAEKYANQHHIPQAYGSYDEILNLPYIDAVYIPLPNRLHFEWSIKSLKAGKNVLCEKPMATSIKEANLLREAQAKSGKTLMEAMHYRYHPVALKIEEIVRGGEIGEIVEVRSSFCQWIPLYKLQNILSKGKVNEAISSFISSLPISKNTPFRPELKEGVLWDMGCYTIDAVRWVANCDKAEVVSAEMKMMRTGVDHTTHARLLFANGVKGEIYVSYQRFFPIEIRVKGSKGSLVVTSPFAPVALVGPARIPVCQIWQRSGITLKPRIIWGETSYYYQLHSFVEAIMNNQKPITSAEECLANTKIIENIKIKAGVLSSEGL
jgi:predicted dehydrogenase